MTGVSPRQRPLAVVLCGAWLAASSVSSAATAVSGPIGSGAPGAPAARSASGATEASRASSGAGSAAGAQATALDRLVVTATRTARSQDQTLAAVTVIDRADIERLQPGSLIDLLRGTPGLSLANHGGAGKATSLFLRGTESDHVLVLVDGIRIGSATSGGASLQDIPVEQIERIEIARGPFSSLYGSEALGGVIQVFTRRPQSAFAPHASLGVGSFDTRRIALGAGGRRQRGDGSASWYAVGASHEDSQGINACRGKPSPRGAGCFTDSPDRDGYRNHALSLRGGHAFDAHWQAELHALRAQTYNEYDGSLNNQAEGAQQVLGARVRYDAPAVALTLNAGSSADLSDTYRDGVYSSTFDTRRRLASLQGDIATGAGTLSLGVDWQHDRVAGSTAYARDRRSNRGAFAQWQHRAGAHAWQASARRDDDSQYGGQATGSALWGWQASDALRVTAGVGSAFKAPTFNELYYPGYGNPDVRAETARSVELGLRGRHGWGGWSLAGYRNRIDDLIAFDAATGAPGNVDRARIRGAELSLDTRVSGWDLHGTASWLDPRNAGAGAQHGNLLPRRARQSARLDIDRRRGDWALGASVYAVGARFDDLANTRRLGGYATTDLRVEWAMTPAWSVQLAANNVSGRRYETAAFYHQPGRNVLLTLRYRPR